MSKPQATQEAQRKARRIRRGYSLSELVAVRIRRLRTTAAAVSRKSGISPSIMTRILNGERKTIVHETAVSLAGALEIDWPRLYEAMREGKRRTENEKKNQT